MAPPRKAICRAALRPSLAACAVRTFERTETFMPMKPAAPERMAPMAKPIAVGQPIGEKPIRRKSTTPTSPIVRYWRFR